MLLALRGAFVNRGWHGPSVLQSIRGLRAKKARKHRAGAAHSIHELVDHVEYWEHVAIHYVRRGRPPKRLRKDWTPPPVPEVAQRGYAKLYREHVQQADEGCDFDFLAAVRK